MGDPRGGAVVCNNRCGYCRCTALSSVSVVGDDHIEDNMGDEHKKCLCGEHCGCNPCTCSKSEIITARALCKCGAACTCAS